MENIFIDTLCKMASEKSNVGTAAKVGAGAAATAGGLAIAKKGFTHELFGGLEKDVGEKINHVATYKSGRARQLKGRLGMVAGGLLAAGGTAGAAKALAERFKKD